MRDIFDYIMFAMLIVFMIVQFLSTIALPFVIFLLGWKEKYRFKPSTYLLLIAGLVGLFVFIEAILFHLTHPIGVFKAAFFIAAAISLIATKAGKKEYLKMFLLFLFPVLLLAGINIVHPFPAQDDIVHQIDAASHDILTILGVFWSFSGMWAFACFYRYCIWRIRRLKMQVAT